MADIGSTLRDTRIRNKIDIGSVEQSTKIRAKYLRALENEEWAVLPGPTYVKSFLRTYAEFLGLDPYLLIEEYNARFEEPEELEVPAFSREQPVRDRVNRVGPPSRATAVVILIVALLGFLLFLGLTGGDDGSKTDNNDPQRSARRAQPASSTAKPKPSAAPKPAGDKVRVKLLPTRDVWVCLVNAKGDTPIAGQTLAAGDAKGPFSSKRFRLTVGNGGGDFAVNGRKRNVPETARPLGYSVTPAGVESLPESQQPTCGA